MFGKYKGKTSKERFDEIVRVSRLYQSADTTVQELTVRVASLEKQLIDVRAEYMAFQRDALLVKGARDDTET